MAANLKIYTGTVTAGGTDGTAVSEGTGSAPITASLVVSDTAGAETAIKCAIRCGSGYTTTGDTILKTVVDQSGSWVDYSGANVKLAADNNYADGAAAISGATWENSLTISNLGATNIIFWVKMSAAAGATPDNDSSVAIYHNATVVATA